MEQCKTLGGNTYFLYSYSNDKLIIINGFKKNKQKFVIVNNEFISKVIYRIKELENNDIKNSRKASYYTDTKWKETANRIYSPYVAKLVLDVFPIETINKILEQYPEINNNK